MIEPGKPIALCILLAVPLRTALGQQGETQFSSVPCHVAFAYPQSWEVVRDTLDPQSACNFLIRPVDWRQRLAAHDSVDLFTISLRSVPGDPAAAAPENGFERRGSRWFLLGEGEARPADTVSGPGWRGWHGIASGRCYREEGAYAGLCDTPTAIAGTATRSVVLVAGTQAEDVFDRVLRTLRLD